MFGTMLASVGILMFISGLIAAARHRRAAAHARLVFGFRPKSIAQVASTRQVRIDGVISASEEACLVAPCSGAPAVWFRVCLRQALASGGGGEGGGGNIWGTILDEQDAIPFYVDDGSGERALVDGTMANAFADARVFETLSPDALERLRSFFIAGPRLVRCGPSSRALVVDVKDSRGRSRLCDLSLPRLWEVRRG